MRKTSEDILIPSEETKVDMFPMDYEEFRWAMGDTATIPLLRTAFEQKMSLGDAVHRRLMRDFRLYMLIGGMPQAVAEYIRTNNMSAVDMPFLPNSVKMPLAIRLQPLFLENM